MVERLVERAAAALEARSSRRGFLERVALASSALAVAPVHYLTRPASAEAVVTCRDCARGSQCCGGWTTFCCTINGGVNACPPYSYVAGWWKCTSYRGTRLCADEGVRYYLDCNRRPGARCPGGCHCGANDCDNRKTCCNNFRYGQCNTDLAGVTEVVCRIVMCVNPCHVYGECDCTMKVNDATCTHEADCLP
ncbi:MAG: twin-arginine translocation signal domain-containing protein [Thermoleophilia bacterium]